MLLNASTHLGAQHSEAVEEALAAKDFNRLARVAFEALVGAVASDQEACSAELRRRDARGMNLLMAYLKNVTSVDTQILQALAKIFENDLNFADDQGNTALIYLVSGRDAQTNRLTSAHLSCMAEANFSLVNYDGRNALHQYLETSYIEVEIVKRLCEPTTKLINKKFRGTSNPNVLFTLLEAVTR